MAGELFLQAGDVQQGVALLSRAESVRPSSHAEVMLAVAYLKQKQPERAHQMLDARSHDPRNPAVFRALANFYREQHDYQAAISALKSAPGQNSRYLPTWVTATNLGRPAASCGYLHARPTCAKADWVAVERSTSGAASGRVRPDAIIPCPGSAD